MARRVERRKNKRFQVESNVLTCCRIGLPKVAEVIDVSKNGMSFSYVGRAGQELGELELDIVFPDGTGYIGKIPCSIVSDLDVGEGVRRSGAKFKRLSQDQRKKLDFFIQNYCVKDLTIDPP